MGLAVRSTAAEEMDDPGLDPAVYERCLADLARVNAATFTHRPVIRWLDRATRGWPAGSAVSVLDVACGQGDLLRAVARWARRRGFAGHLEGIDLNPRSTAAALAATPEGMGIAYRTGDVFGHVPDPRPDFIVTSQFAHHLDAAAVGRLLRWLDGNAARGWFIADLHRHWFPYYGFRWLARLAGWHPIVRRDGTVSIARGFRGAEWRALLDGAGVAGRVAWSFPFRHGVSALR